MTGIMLLFCLFQRKVIFPIAAIIVGISLIYASMKIIIKIITNRISKYAFFLRIILLDLNNLVFL